MAVKRTKRINTSRVMHDIWTSRETSRVEIARSLGLDKSTVSAIVNDLIDVGLISETREGSAGPLGGRKPVHITLNGKFGCVLGIELRPESYTAVGVDLNGEVVFSKFEKMQLAGSDLRASILDIVDRVDVERERCGLRLLGIGVGLSGVVNPHLGVIRFSIPLNFDEPINLYEEMAGEFDVPFLIENDANASAWGELAFHRHRELRDFLYCLVEFREVDRHEVLQEKISIGFGIAIAGSVHYGHEFSAGEFRSIFRDPEHLGQVALSREEAFRIEEDPKIMNRFVRELSRHIALFVNTFNLSHVFLGGSLDFEANRFRDILAEEIDQNWPYPNPVSTRIGYSSLRERAVAFGAAGMVLERMFADIELVKGVTREGGWDATLLPGVALAEGKLGTYLPEEGR
ncbi:MAG: ROK family transcriptional regulator [Alkalispirochaetaceae bacterium]